MTATLTGLPAMPSGAMTVLAFDESVACRTSEGGTAVFGVTVNQRSTQREEALVALKRARPPPDEAYDGDMKPYRLGAVLTLLNLALLVVLLARGRSAEAGDVPPVLRGRALEIVDDHGKVRASIQVLPVNTTAAMPDGTRGYPETVLLRLVTAEGRPSVKLSATERGGILVLGGESDPTYAQLKGDRGTASLTLVGKDGHPHTLEH